MKIALDKQEKENLFFILSEFINTHIECGLYKNEVRIAKKVIKKIKL